MLQTLYNILGATILLTANDFPGALTCGHGCFTFLYCPFLFSWKCTPVFIGLATYPNGTNISLTVPIEIAADDVAVEVAVVAVVATEPADVVDSRNSLMEYVLASIYYQNGVVSNLLGSKSI
jgi:hypothetical protein